MKTPLEQLEEYLADPQKAIQLKRLITGEARKLHATLNASEFLKKDKDDHSSAFTSKIAEYDGIVEDLVQMFVSGCYHGNEEQNLIWAEGITIIGDTGDHDYPSDRFLRLRRYPALLLFYAAGIAAVAGENYKVLTALFARTQIRRWGLLFPIVEQLPPDAVIYSDDQKAIHSNHRTPLVAHLRNYLARFLKEVTHTDEAYFDNFSRFEYLFALYGLAKGQGIITGSYMWESEVHRKYRQSHYQGRIPVINDIDDEIKRDSENWLPFKAGLFGGIKWDEFLRFKNSADEKIVEAVRKRGW